jgi:hypothetical protein
LIADEDEQLREERGESGSSTSHYHQAVGLVVQLELLQQ